MPKADDIAPAPAPTPPRPLLTQAPCVINIGLPAFADDLARNGARVVHVDWSPPAGGDAELAALLAKLGA
jgi:hypothetical protein